MGQVCVSVVADNLLCVSEMMTVSEMAMSETAVSEMADA